MFVNVLLQCFQIIYDDLLYYSMLKCAAMSTKCSGCFVFHSVSIHYLGKYFWYKNNVRVKHFQKKNIFLIIWLTTLKNINWFWKDYVNIGHREIEHALSQINMYVELQLN